MRGWKIRRARVGVTWDQHLRQPRKNADALGHSARRHYWLAPRSDDAVGAEVLGQGAGEVAAVAIQLMPLRVPRDRLGQRGRFSSDA